MADMASFKNLGDLIIKVGNESVLLDSDVAAIYGVETRDINKAVANNPKKFPAGYVIELSAREKIELVENFHRFNNLKHSVVNPKAFSEKGLYMLATILKSARATEATLSIIETFSKIRELSRNMRALPAVKNEGEQKSLMQRSGQLISDIFDDDARPGGTETSFEVNFAVLKFKHIIKKGGK